MQGDDISRERGLEVLEFPGSMGVVLLRAGIDQVGPHLANLLGRNLETGVQGRDLGYEALPVFQLKGHPWTLTTWDCCRDDDVIELSRRCDCPAIYLDHEDTSGWTGFRFIEDGDIVEEFRFGMDYSDELAELAEMTGDSSVMQSSEVWDVDVTDDEGDQYQFRSKVRDATEQEVASAQQFLSDALLRLDAWIPSYFRFPASEERFELEGIDAADVVRVDALLPR